MEIRNVTTSSDSFSYTFTGIGTHEIHCRSLDTQGAESSTAIINVTSANRAPDLPTIASGGVTTAALGSAVSLTGTLRDLDGNLAYHALSYLPPGGSWTLVPGATTTPSNGTNSTITGSFTPNAIGAWQFKTSGHDGSLWAPEAILSVAVYDGTAPSVPGGLVASVITSTTFTLSWSSSSDNVGVTAYEVMRDLTSLGTTGGLSLAIGTLTANTTYSMKVRAGDGANNWSDWSSPLSVTTLPNPPAAPIAGAATSITGSSFTANWSASGGATSYRLDVSTSNTFASFVSGYQNLDVGNVTSRSVSGLATSTTYYYRVRAVNTGGMSADSTTISLTTLPGIPGAPTTAAATSITGSSFTANWSASGGATSYRLDVSTSNTFASFVSGYQNLDVGNVTSRSVSGLATSTTYYYRVRAVNAGGTSGDSTTISLTTLPSPPSAPAAGGATSITGSSFTANWSASGGATSYRLDVSTSNTFANFVSGYQNLDVGNITSWSVSGLATSTTYYYRVRAVNAGGTSGDSTTISLTTLPSPPSAPAVGGATSITGSNFTANWSASGGATSYWLDVSTSNTFASFVSGYQNLDVGNVTSRSVSGLATSTTYYYRVRAVNSGGVSGYSTTISLTTLPPPPAAPTAGTATSVAGTSFTANWSASGGATSYRLDVSTSGTFASFVSGFQNLDVGNATTQAVTGLAVTTTYYYRVRAVNAGGTSGHSNTITLTTQTPQTITFLPPGTRTYTDVSFALSATASSGLPVTFTHVSGPATVSGNIVTLGTTRGTVVIRASQSGNATHSAAPTVDQSFLLVGRPELTYDGGSIPAGWPNVAGPGSKAVGVTLGKLNVDKSGGANYSIPIWVSPGTAGMQPQLGLNYSSQAGAGISGFGWSLSGISVITRGPQTRAVDGQVKGVTFTSSDRFYLDGQRLMAISGADGAANTEYRTEVESFSKIVSYGSAGNGPAWFKVWTKAGLIIEFGNTADSAAEAQGRTERAVWAVNKISDTAGNYMTFTYEEDSGQGEQRLTRIDYTGNGLTFSPYASVRFTYEPRNDAFRGYASGSKVSRTQRLKSIGSYYGDQLVRKYSLDYTNRSLATGDQLGRSMLTGIQEAGTDGVEYPASTFEYDTNTAGWDTASSWTPPTQLANSDGNPRGTGFVDLNGDGRPDLLQHRLVGSTPTRGAWFNTVTGWTAAGSGFYPPTAAPLAKDGVSDTGTRLADANGDGLTDIFDVNARCYLATSTGFVHTPAWNVPNPPPYSGVNYYGIYEDPSFMDLNGDGRVDFVGKVTIYQQGGVPMGYTANVAWLNTGTGWQQSTAYYPPLDMTRGSRFIDVNGDGLPDHVQHWQDQGTILKRVALNTGSGWNLLAVNSADETKFLPPTVLNRNGGGTDASPVGSELVDLNGDGLIDLVRRHLNVVDGAWLNTGNGWVSTGSFNSPFVLTDNLTPQGIVLLDINSDGLADMVQAWGASSRDVRLGTAQGWSASAGGHSGSAPTGYGVWRQVGQSGTPTTGTDFVDINADGAVDQLWNWGGTGASSSAVVNRAVPADRLTKVTNGFGIEASIDYAPLTERDGTGGYTVYDKGTGGPAGSANVIGPMYVVKSVSNDDGVGGQHSISYRYGGMRADVLRGNLGFETMTVIDDRTGIVSSTSFRQDYPYIGMPLSSVTMSGSVTLSSSNTVYDQKLLNSGKSRFIFAKTVTSTNRDLNGDIVSQSTTTTQRGSLGDSSDYDPYGNSLYVSVDTGGGYVKTTTSTYTNNTTDWILGRLNDSTVDAAATGKPTLTRESAFTYDSTTGFLLTEVVEPNTPALKLTTTYEYDDFGNKLNATVSGSGVTSRTTSTAYSTNGRFPISSTNAAGHTESYIYDPHFGVVETLTGPNTLSTSWNYDRFGAKIKETRSDGTISNIHVKWAGAEAPAGAKYFVETTATGIAPSLVFHDAMGRAIRSLAINGAGQIVYQDTAYDSMGRAYASTVPYRSGATVYWTQTTSYDVLNRPLTVQTPDDQVSGGVVTTSFSYSGLTTEVTDAEGRVARSVKNAQGQVTQSIRDLNGLAATVTYGYDALGNLTSTNAAGVATTLTYDIRGRKTGMVDADMGTWSYAYNVFGELTSQTDAKSQTTTMTYDVLGRLKSRTEVEGTTTWTYDTAANGKGKLASVTSPGGYSETYTYDSQGRPTAVARTITGTTYTMGQTYDSIGRPDKTVYPTGFQTKNVYNAFGFVKQVRRADSNRNDLYWMADTYAEDGRVNGDTYGNMLTGDRVYSGATGRLLGAGIGLAPASGIQFLVYGYDAVGNVTTRNDGATGRNETFTYDTLDRLVSHALSGSPTVTMAYDAKGNITSKSDVGTYTYGSGAGPHAVTGITGGALGAQSYAYDSNGNMTSGGGRAQTWTSFNQLKTVTKGGNYSNFEFGAAHERVKQVSNSGTTIYVGGLFELSTGTSGAQEKNFIMTPTGRVGVATFGGGVAALGATNYFHTDGLGSITAVTDENGNVVKRFAFDAWGKRINPATGVMVTSATNGTFTRGYTDHEHLDDVGLIHMNGRVYDPILGRFLSADPFVDGAHDSQGYNRYSYVGNNSLNKTDPSGFFKLKDALVIVAIVVVAIVTAGAALAALAPGAFSLMGGVNALFAGGLSFGQAVAAGAGFGFGSGFAGSLLNGGNIGDAFKAGVIGAVVGGISGGIAHGIGTMAQDWSWGLKAAAHGAAQGGVTEAMGGEFRHGFYAGFFSSAAASSGFIDKAGSLGGGAGRVAAAATVGGTASAIGGGKFANGAVSGAFIQMFNEGGDHGDPGYEIMNQSEVEGKKIVGSYVTDEANWNRSDNETVMLNGKIASRLAGKIGQRWSKDATSINEKLAVNGEAIEVAVVRSRVGYENYLRSLASRSGDTLQVLTATFHGSGTDSNGYVLINGRASYTKATQPGVSWGFFARTRNLIGPSVGFYDLICSPDDGYRAKAIGMAHLRNDLIGK